MNKETIAKDAGNVFIGVDVHRRQYTVSCIRDGAVVKRCRIPGSPECLVAFMRKFFPDCEIYSAYEAGFSGFRLHRELTRAGIHNMVVHAASIELPQKKSKTDKRDSLKIAEQLSGGRLRGIQIPSEEQEHRRAIVRTRDQLMRTRTRCMNQIRMKLHHFGLFPSEYRGVLRTEFVEGVIESGVAPQLSLALQGLLSMKRAAELEVKRLDQEIREYAKRCPLIAIYDGLPGVGVLSAYYLAAELGDLKQFPNERSLFSFTGLVPGEFTTDETRRLGHISREGRSSLRHILVEAAWMALRKDPVLRETFERIAAKAGKKRAIVAIARKLIGRARALFRKQEVYELNYRRAA